MQNHSGRSSIARGLAIASPPRRRRGFAGATVAPEPLTILNASVFEFFTWSQVWARQGLLAHA